MIIDDTDSMIAPLCPHVADGCPGLAFSRVSPDLWMVFPLTILTTFTED